MVRRVGFGDNDRPPRKNRKLVDATAPAPSSGAARSTRLFVGAFLVIWLTLWSAAIAFSVNQIMAQGFGAADMFLFIWVGVASVFWLLAVNMLWRILTGRSLSGGARSNWGRAPKSHGGANRGDWDHGADD